jgi:hypothetical protein
MEEMRKRQLALQEAQVQNERAEREREEKKEQREKEIRLIMKQHSCDFDEAYQIWSRPNVDIEAVRREKQNNDIKENIKRIKKEYPDYKFILQELDQEHRKKAVGLSGESLLQFLETLKPQIQQKLKFEKDETWLDDEHFNIYFDRTLDEQFQCMKIKDKLKRHKFLDTFVKSRVEEINESLHCV